MTLSEERRGYPDWRAAEAPARVEPRSATSRGSRISYDHVGEGKLIVLVHGFTLSGGAWWETGYVQRLVALGRRVLSSSIYFGMVRPRSVTLTVLGARSCLRAASVPRWPIYESAEIYALTWSPR